MKWHLKNESLRIAIIITINHNIKDTFDVVGSECQPHQVMCDSRGGLSTFSSCSASSELHFNVRTGHGTTWTVSQKLRNGHVSARILQRGRPIKPAAR